MEMYFWTQKTEVGCLWPTSLFSLFSNPLSSSFPFIALSLVPCSPSPSLSLPIFYSIHPCSAGVSLHEHNHGLCETACVCVCEWEWERDEMGMYNVQQMTQHLRTGHAQSFSRNSETYTQSLHNFIWRNKSVIKYCVKWLHAISDFPVQKCHHHFIKCIKTTMALKRKYLSETLT